MISRVETQVIGEVYAVANADGSGVTAHYGYKAVIEELKSARRGHGAAISDLVVIHPASGTSHQAESLLGIVEDAAEMAFESLFIKASG